MNRNQTLQRLRKELKRFLLRDYEDFLRKSFPFKIPSNYLQWDELVKIFDIGFKFLEVNAPPELRMGIDQQALIWASYQNPKIYCIAPDLLEQFQLTDVGDRPELLIDLKCPISSFILLAPSKSIKSPCDDSAYIDYLVINILGENHPIPPEYFSIYKEVPRVPSGYKFAIFWSGIDSKGNPFMSMRGVRKDGKHSQSVFLDSDPEKQKTTLELREIVLQVVMSLEFKPDLIEDIQSNEIKPQSKGFSKPQNKKDCLYPRWIGKQYRKSSNQSKKSPHWVRGHWRRQPKGKRENPEYRWIWIEPFCKG